MHAAENICWETPISKLSLSYSTLHFIYNNYTLLTSNVAEIEIEWQSRFK